MCAFYMLLYMFIEYLLEYMFVFIVDATFHTFISAISVLPFVIVVLFVFISMLIILLAFYNTVLVYIYFLL